MNTLSTSDLNKIALIKQNVNDDVSVKYHVRKLKGGDRLYILLFCSTHGVDYNYLRKAESVIKEYFPDAVTTSGSPRERTIATWLTRNPPSPEEAHQNQIEEIVNYFQGYVRTYTQQPHYKDFSLTTVIDDMIYGLGVAIGGDQYKWANGYRRWKDTLKQYLNADDLPLGNRIQILKTKQYDPNYGDDRLCKCGHSYHRHFDSYEEMRPVGCKYCECGEFEEL